MGKGGAGAVPMAAEEEAAELAGMTACGVDKIVGEQEGSARPLCGPPPAGFHVKHLSPTQGLGSLHCLHHNQKASACVQETVI